MRSDSIPYGAVRVTLRSHQDETDCTTEYSVTGLLTEGNGGYPLLTYQEPPDTGMGCTSTAIEWGENRIILTRTGDVSSRMIFQVDSSVEIAYNTRYGAVCMTLTTQRLNYRFSRYGGLLDLRYTLTQGTHPVGTCQMKVSIKK